MLLELRVENLLVIERAELRLAEGLNVVTGETGAGKSVLAHAIDLLLGARPRAGIVRPGAGEAYVEGVFELDEPLRAELGDRLPPDADELVLARRVGSDGRTRALIAGRSATVGELRELAGRLIAFHGQHEHRRLLDAPEQLAILDDFAGPEQGAAVAELAGAFARLAALRARLRELAAGEAGRAGELELLELQFAEFERVAPEGAEAEELRAARERLRSLDVLRLAAAGAAQALEGTDEAAGAAQSAALAADALAAGRADAALGELADRADALAIELRDLAGEVDRFAATLDGGATLERGPLAGAQPTLEAVEARLADFERLERRHGAAAHELPAVLERLLEQREQLMGAGESAGELERETGVLEEQYGRLAGEVSKRRREAAPALAAAVRTHLEDLAMPGALFEVALGEAPAGPRGTDSVEFRLAANPGVPAAPVSAAASGGELSRVMLAILAVAGAGGEAGTTVFDEVDAGIGGRTARAVGNMLRELAGRGQVVCITHLAQIASLGDRHFALTKDTGAQTSLTTVSELGEQQLVGELVRMLGARADDPDARAHAEGLLRAA